MNNRYGFIGLKGSGKDTIADMVMAKDPSWKVLKFAAKLKSACADVFHLNHDQIEGSLKETKLETPISMDEHICDLSVYLGIDIKPRDLIAETPRQVMQYLGTDYVRYVVDSYWLDSLHEQVNANPMANIMITDCRFHNEARLLRGLGFKMVKIAKVDFPDQPKDLHPSEQEIMDIEADITLYNKFGDMDVLKNFAEEILKTGY